MGSKEGLLNTSTKEEAHQESAAPLGAGMRIREVQADLQQLTLEQISQVETSLMLLNESIHSV